MSAVKRVFTHSAIRSAIRKPFVPGDDGYREYIQRSVPEFDGTQYAELSEETVIPPGTPFEIEVIASVADNGDFHQVLSGLGNFTFNVKADDGMIFYNAGGVEKTTIDLSVPRGKILKFRLLVTDAETYIGYNDTLEGGIGIPAQDISILRIGQQTTFGTPSPLEGCVFSLKIWTNGDRNTGDLILDIPFDERDTDYQCNRAVSLGQELAGTTPPTAAGSTWEDLGMGQYRATSDGSYLTIKWNCTQGKHYLVSYDIEYLGGGGIRLNSATDITPWDFSSTDRTVVKLVVADGDTIGFKHDNSCDFIISNISIQEFSGAILQNFVHGDGGNWLDIERKRYWDYWLGVELHDKANYATYLEAVISEDGEAIHLLPGNSAGINSWYGHEIADLVVGNNYKVVHEHDITSGFIRVRIGGGGAEDSTGETIGVSGVYEESLINSAAGSTTLLALQSQSVAPVVKSKIRSIRRKLEIAS